MIDYPWDLVEHNAEALAQDYRHWRQRTREPRRAGRRRRRRAGGAAASSTRRPRSSRWSLIDTTKGPVLIDRGAVVQAFSRLEGPCYIGPDTPDPGGADCAAAASGRSAASAARSRRSIVQGYSNKSHDGFLGHSYVGEWVNLGAGTQTSDLRNDYGTIACRVDGQHDRHGPD